MNAKRLMQEKRGLSPVSVRFPAVSRMMDKMIRFVGLLLFGMLGWVDTASAVSVCTSKATGNWNAATTWTCVGAPVATVPGAADSAVILSPHIVTLTANAPVTGLTVNTGGTLATGALILTATGNIDISGTISGTGRIYSNGPALTPITISGTGTFNGVRLYTSGTGGTTIPAGSNLNFLGASRLYAGNNGAGALAGSVLTVNGTITAAATVSLRAYTGTALAPGLIVGTTGVINATGATFAVQAAAAVANNGNVTLASVTGANATTSIWTQNANSTLNVSAALLATGVLNASASGNTVNYNGAAAQTIKAPSVAGYGNLTLSGSLAKTTAAGLTVNGDLTLTGAATFTAGTSLTHTIAGSFIVDTTAITPFTWTTASIFNFNTPAISAATTIGGASAATLAFNDVNINNTSGVTLVENASFSTGTTPTLTVAAGATLTPAAAVIISGTGTLTGAGTVQVTRTIAGSANFSSQYTIATKTLTNLTVEYIGAAAQTVSVLTYGSATGGGLKVNNASGVSLTANTTVAGTLTLASGVVNAGAFTLIGSGDCTTKMLRTGGHVAGNLQLQFPTGAPSCTFHVGDATAYRPITTAFASVTAAGPLVGAVSQAAGDHPSIASSGLDATKSVNRYWTITDPVGGTIAYTTYSATFNFANPGDIDAGANALNFEAEYWNGTAWTTTTVGTQGATSNQASGIASPSVANSYAAFAVAEKISPPVVVSIVRADANPTSAATVSWTVTFSKSVTGVDATDFALAATGVSGTFIAAVTGSGTTWTVTANTGIGSGTLGLNLVDDDTIVDAGGRKLGGTGVGNGNFTGEIYTITATPSLAEYRMDEASWNGTANEVADSSGSGNHAQAFNSASTIGTTPAIATNPGTCRYGVFDNGGTITQGYVQTPLPDLTADFTIAAWIRTTNNTITGQRILIDDQNNTGGYGLSLGDGAAGILRFYSRGITPVILDSTYTIANNTWYFVAAVADITNKKRTIYVFDAAGALLNSTTEAAWTGGAWGTDAGPVSIGGEVNGPPQTEPPATFHFRGNLDEVRVYQKVLSQAALAAIAAQTHACPINIPDHLVIQSSGSGLTCAASTLTVVACADATCATPYTLGVSGTLSATGAPTVNWDGTTGGAAGAGFVIPNGSSSVTKNVQVATAGSVVFGITSPSPVPASATTCNFGTPSCTFTANTAGFIFSNTTTGGTYTIPAQVSGITTPALYLRAVQATTTNAAVCTPAIIGQTTPVTMGYTCNNPTTCQAGNLTTINATAIASGGTAVSLTFDANGSAPITARYDDVGQITLNANKTVTPFGGSTPVTLNGSSNAFVVAPHHFGFSGITAGLIKAGNNFSATVTAYNGLGAATPNFGKETAPEGVTLVSNLASGNNPTPANNLIAGTEFGAGGMVSDPDGVATVNNLSWGEVGIITLTANLTSGSYLGSGLTATGTSSNVGRHTPDHFDTVVTGGMPCPTGLTCPLLFNGFVYSGQSLTTKVIARNLAGGTTLNYDSARTYSKAVTLTAWNAAGGVTANPGGGALTLNTVPSTAFILGEATTATPTYTFTTTPTAPTDIYIRADESLGGDGVTSLRGVSSVEGGMKIVGGRMKVSNAHGSELLTLPIGVTVQYWNGTNYVTSATDSLTTFASTNVVFATWQKLTPLSGWTTGSTSVVTPPASVVFANGVGSFILAKPGTNNTGSVDLTTNAPSYLPSNTARATFGVYKGNNNFIYLRENY